MYIGYFYGLWQNIYDVRLNLHVIDRTKADIQNWLRIHILYVVKAIRGGVAMGFGSISNYARVRIVSK